MSKRFTETAIWNEDWFLELPSEYKLLWFYIKDNCNHAGIWRPNKRIFEAIINGKVNINKAMELFNIEKERIIVLKSGRWLLNDFFCFQYGDKLNENNRVHKSIKDIYEKEEINMTSIRGLKDLKDRPKDKDKDKDKLNNVTPDETPKKKVFTIPTLKEIQDYCFERKNKVDAKKFFNFYESKGWMVGKNKMKNWMAAVRTWENDEEVNEKPIKQVDKKVLDLYK